MLLLSSTHPQSVQPVLPVGLSRQQSLNASDDCYIYVVLSANPGRLLKEIKIPLPRPRTSELLVDLTFAALKKDCFDLIRQESLQAFNQQMV